MEYFNLTTPQKNIWNLQAYYEGTAITNLCGAVFYEELRDIECLQKAINQIIRKQSALRLQFVNQEGEVKQYVKEYCYVNIPVHEFADEKAFGEYAKELASSPMEQDMYRFEIVMVGDKQGVLAIFNHLIADAWTFSLIVKEVDEAYQNLLMGKEVNSENSDYIRYVQEDADYFNSILYKKDEAYWQDKYAFKPELSTIKNESVSSGSIASKRVERKLAVDLTTNIQSYCAKRAITPAVLLEAVLFTYLFKINSKNHFVTIGVPVLNRTKMYEKKTAGMFISTVPFTVELSEEDTVKQVMDKILEVQVQAFRHQRYPYSMILKNLREKQNFEGNLYDVMFSFQNAHTDAKAVTKWYSNGYSEIPFTLHVDNRDSEDAYTLTVDFQTSIFREGEEVRLILDRFEYVLAQMLKEASVRLKDISIMPDAEIQRVLSDFNDTAVDYPRDKCVHELFMEQAARTPEAVAVVFEDRKLTYRELDEMSNGLAHVLQEKGVKRGDIVPLIAKRSYYIPVAMLGILKAGAAYMPIAPDYPKDRVQFIVEEAKSKVACVLGYEECLDGVELLKLDELHLEDVESTKKQPIENQNSAEDLCYIIFTSGSTGVPKGIMLAHRTITNLVHWQQSSGVLEGSKNILSFTAIIFDVFTQEVFSTILSGNTLFLINDSTKNNIQNLKRYITQVKADTLYCTPSYYKVATKQDALGINKVILAGESFGVNKNVQNSSIIYFNQYGPAETHVVTCSRVITHKDITIGKPIANTQIYILDSHGKPVPIGVPGELCIAGEGVGKGYLNRPELTAERFVPNPFATEKNGHGKVMYHTGDLAAWRANGEIEYLGRIDTQVKIRGLRIELGEIESVMSEFPGIGMCAVTDKKDEEGRQYLVGYYTTVSDEKERQDLMTAVHMDEKELRKHLSAKLPKYMVPNYFMHLEKLPMTPSGKTDRKNLPCPNLSIRSEEELVLPQNELEEKLLKLWKEELHIEWLGCNQDFFEVGGDSLLAIALLTRLEQEFGVRLQMKDLFECRTVTAQAGRLEVCVGEKRDIIVAMNTNRFPLTPQQRAVYLASVKEPESLLYNMPAQILLPEHVDRKRLMEALQRVFRDFAALHMRVSVEADGLYGVIDSECELCIESYEEVEKEKFVRPFDLEKAPLWRVGFTERYLLMDMHHLIADGSSLQILIQAVQDLYEGKRLVSETVGYGDYAVYLEQKLNAEAFEEGLNWYKESLPLSLEKASFPKTYTESGFAGENYQYQMAEETKEAVKRICEKYQVTETMVHMTVYALLLKYYSGQETVAGSMIVANRQHQETEHTIGMFVNTLPISFHFAKELSVEALLQECREKLLKLYEYAELPFATIVENVGKEIQEAINTSFVYQANSVFELALDGQKLVHETIDTHTAKFDLTVEVTPNEKGDFLRLEYRTDKLDKALAQRMARSYEKILRQLAEKEMVGAISALTKDEEQKILNDFNDTAVDYPRDKCVHELFMEQAARTPEAVAVVFEDRKLTYRELDEMSNGLAVSLRRCGVKKGDFVGVLLKRDEKVIIAQLAILKLGAVFIPVDNRYPKDRIDYIIKESRMSLLIKNKDIDIELEGTIDIEELSMQPMWNFRREKIDSNDVCYIIFTSGSTGTPKGCTLTNRGLVNFCRNNNILETCNQLEQKNAVSVNTISFDFFIAESLLPLINGYTIVLANEEESINQEKFVGLITKNKVNIIQTTPTRYRLFFDKKRDISFVNQFDIFVSSGEALSLDLLKTFGLNRHAKVFNPLGPSECSVWVVGGELHCENNVGENTITIGKPIANTQIYILDSHGKPVPIGVPGELCIAGEGVGKGYLNRPELTAERFVPNPFATEKNGHGKVMYHTGDLAAWRANGEIEYLGRIDTQVKIRGLRIELGEIESVMSEFPGIGMCAVTDKKDEEGRQYLVGYYTTVSDEKERQDLMTAVHMDEKELRKHLSAKLPKYMVPNFFMHLNKLPMTPSGKTDRKNLPVPKGIRTDLTEYVAPVTEMEKKLCQVMEEILDYSPIGLMHDFFEYGGDSLKAMEFIVKLEEVGYRVSLQDIFEYPSASALVEKLQNQKSEEMHIEYLSNQFEKYTALLERNTVREKDTASESPFKTVLLSGITGFLGAHIADALLQEEECVIYCLVRSKNQEDRRGRFPEILEYYFGNKYKEYIGTRIIPVVGDITDEKFSEKLPEKVDMVIHAAATVKHYGAYEYFYKVNTLGTKHMADYALRVGAKYIHISTISVSGNSLADGFDTEVAIEEREFGEDCLYQGQDLKNVYVRSKFEAECVVLDAMLQGLQANIIRVGNLTNRSRDYVFQPNYRENAFLSRIKGALELGCLPDYMMPLYSEFSPVDDTARAIVKIARHFHMEHTVYHVYSNQNLYFSRLLEILKELGISMAVVEGARFEELLKATVKEKRSHIYEAFVNDIGVDGKLNYETNIHIQNDFTIGYLKQLGFEWTKIDYEYVKGYIEYFKKLGYLEV